jgi:hypothetical protein
MVKKERRRLTTTSGESVANALDRWDKEGGAAAALWPLPYEIDDLKDVERRVLECLGAALVSEWNSLPTDVQRTPISARRAREAICVALGQNDVIGEQT